MRNGYKCLLKEIVDFNKHTINITSNVKDKLKRKLLNINSLNPTIEKLQNDSFTVHQENNNHLST